MASARSSPAARLSRSAVAVLRATGRGRQTPPASSPALRSGSASASPAFCARAPALTANQNTMSSASISSSSCIRSCSSAASSQVSSKDCPWRCSRTFAKSEGATGGAMYAVNLLKPMLGRGELRCIGATTLNQYRKYIEKNPALERRFQQVFCGQPSVEDTISILCGLRERYELHHGVKISDNALVSAAILSDRYITEHFLPD